MCATSSHRRVTQIRFAGRDKWCDIAHTRLNVGATEPMIRYENRGPATSVADKWEDMTAGKSTSGGVR